MGRSDFAGSSVVGKIGASPATLPPHNPLSCPAGARAIDHLFITANISIPETELDISYVRSPGPGGQNVNKVSSAAQLRFDLKHSPSLPDAVKIRAADLAGSRFTKDGEIVISASRFRAQPQNREDAIARLVELLQAAAVAPKFRRPTRPTLASKRRRIEGKAQRGETKRLRSGKPGLD